MTNRIKGLARSPKDNSEVLIWNNDSGEVIPAYACIKLDSYDTVGRFYVAKKPDGSGNLHFVNGPVPIAVGAYGESNLWTKSRLGKTIAPAVFGSTVGPVANEWNMTTGGLGWTVFSNVGSIGAALLRDGGGGGDIIHGIIRVNQTCGYYLVELSIWNSNKACDPCGSGAYTLQSIPKDEFVIAYDPASTIVPLVMNSDCLLTNTGSDIYQIMRGHQEHLEEAIETWQCCPDALGNMVNTLVSRKKVRFPGIVCDEEILDDCT